MEWEDLDIIKGSTLSNYIFQGNGEPTSTLWGEIRSRSSVSIKFQKPLQRGRDQISSSR